MPTATPISFKSEELDEIAFGADGLVPAIVQEVAGGEVLMLGYMDREALRRTLESGRTWFWSRSRSQYWCKGETSGNRQWVRRAYFDCDADALLILVEQEGGAACHTGERTCFHRAFGEADLVAGGAERYGGSKDPEGPGAPAGGREDGES